MPIIAIANWANAAVEIADLGGKQFRVTWTYSPDQKVDAVYLAGSFNAWKPADIRMDGPSAAGAYTAFLDLPEGLYEYKFVVNGKDWRPDPDNPQVSGPHRNSVLRLGPAAVTDPAEAPDGRSVVPAIAPVPPSLQRLIEAARTAAKPGDASAAAEGSESPEALVKAYLREHRMPVFESAAVAFVAWQPDADRVVLQLHTHGRRTGHTLNRPIPGLPLFTIALAANELPDRAAYMLQIDSDKTGSSVIRDPYARSCTSREGKPAGAVMAPSPDHGRIEVFEFACDCCTMKPRALYIYLPPGYDDHPDRRYPVLYAHDGQNLWDDPTEPFGHGGWQLNVIADELISAGKIEPFIAIGIANTPDRVEEYGPGADIFSATGHEYLYFLTPRLRVLLEEEYRMLPGAKHTALMGSSLGANISLQAALLNPDAFGAAACLSPACRFRDKNQQGYADLVERVGKQPIRLYVDHGTAGPSADGSEETDRLIKTLKNTGWKEGEDLLYFVDEGAQHNERYWRARLRRPLIFLFGTDAADRASN